MACWMEEKMVGQFLQLLMMVEAQQESLSHGLNLKDGTMTPSLKIDSVSVIPILNVGDTLQVEFSIYAKLKIESGDRILSLE